MREAFQAGLKKSCVPILFDDMTPEQAGGVARGSLPLESLKLIMEVQQSSSLSARFKDFSFAANVPRIFTSNAQNPKEFHSALPANPWSLTNQQRCALPASIKAAFKRTCFALVSHPMVPDDIRAARSKARRIGDAFPE